MIQGRVFTLSLKPVWNEVAIKELLNKMTGSAIIYAINHTHDTDDDGNQVEAHTHFYVEYETPRKISTIANLFNVDDNFIEIVKSKRAMLRYLTHKDDEDKYQYNDDDVYTNSDVEYSQAILGASMSDKEIAKALQEGRGVDLLGVVSASKLRTIQAFLQYDRTGAMYKVINDLKDKVDSMSDSLSNIDEAVTGFFDALRVSVANSGEALSQGIMAMHKIADELEKTRHMVIARESRSHKQR